MPCSWVPLGCSMSSSIPFSSSLHWTSGSWPSWNNLGQPRGPASVLAHFIHFCRPVSFHLKRWYMVWCKASARAYYKKFMAVLLEEGFIQSAADPCLYVRWDDMGIIYIAMYVDDCLCMGDNKAIRNKIAKIGKHFKLKIKETFLDYLSCKILFNKDRMKIWIGQPHMIKKIKNTFREMVIWNQNYKMPGTPHHRASWQMKSRNCIEQELECFYIW